MQKIFRYRKFIGLTMLISIFFLNLPPHHVRAVMITTEYVIHQDTEQLSDRARLLAFLGRADVMAQMQANGISHEFRQALKTPRIHEISEIRFCFRNSRS